MARTLAPGIDLVGLKVVGYRDEQYDQTEMWRFGMMRWATDLTDVEILRKIVGDREEVEYTLEIEAIHGRMAAGKARGWVRSHNPFSPGFLKVFDVDKVNRRNLKRDTYRVRIIAAV